MAEPDYKAQRDALLDAARAVLAGRAKPLLRPVWANEDMAFAPSRELDNLRAAVDACGDVVAWEFTQQQVEVDPVAALPRLHRERFGVVVAEPDKPHIAPCVVCGKPTAWACADCGIDGVKPLPHVCPDPACRDAHEQAVHPKKEPSDG